jgi:transcriptional regulator with XRE-family HTH domain
MTAACYNAPSMGERLAENLRRLRKERGLTQRELAERTKLSEIAIIKLEAGDQKNPTLRTVRLLAWALGASYDDLIPPIGQADSPDALV